MELAFIRIFEKVTGGAWANSSRLALSICITFARRIFAPEE
tara:strand:+ start:1441 stop:1563 length:123 start_codon:yes stop_codon:yes gene_type:complete